MNRYFVATALSISALTLSACNSSNSENTSLQALHASKDAPLANIMINGSTELSGVDYGVASGYLSVPSGWNSVQVDVQLPGSNTATAIPVTDLFFNAANKYTVIVVGEADASSANPVEALVVSRPVSGDADESTLDVQVVHAAAGVPDVDLYVTGVGDDINTASSLDTLAFMDDTGVVNIPGGDYRIRLALAGTKTVVFDSGSLPLSSDSELTIAAIPNTNQTSDSSPVRLVIMDGTSASALYNITDKAQVRVGHLVYDAPQVDVALNGTEAISDIDFKEVTPYAELAGEEYDVAVFAFDDFSGSTVIDDPDVLFSPGLDYTVYAVDLLASIEPLVMQDERRKVATSAVLNVLHAAQNPAAASVDIYLTTTSDFASSAPAIEDFQYKQSVQQVYISEGTYYVTVTAANDNTAVIGPAMISVEDGKVYQAIAVSDSVSTFDLLVNEVTE